jgi:hypothetical protein
MRLRVFADIRDFLSFIAMIDDVGVRVGLDGRVVRHKVGDVRPRAHRHAELEVNLVVRGTASYLLGDRRAVFTPSVASTTRRVKQSRCSTILISHAELPATPGLSYGRTSSGSLTRVCSRGWASDPFRSGLSTPTGGASTPGTAVRHDGSGSPRDRWNRLSPTRSAGS